MVGVDSFTCGKVVGPATFNSKSAWQPVFRASLRAQSPPPATTLLRSERFVSHIYSLSRSYSPPSFGMDVSADAGRTYSPSSYCPFALSHEIEDMPLYF